MVGGRGIEGEGERGGRKRRGEEEEGGGVTLSWVMEQPTASGEVIGL